jgi:hypothetical protein
MFDLVVHGGTVVTAADTFACDVGMKGSRMVAHWARAADEF